MPITEDVWGAVASDCRRAMPKSMTFTSPARVTITLAGLMSRCTMPCACAAASAPEILSANSTPWIGVGLPPPARNDARVRPSMYSMTMYCVSPSAPVSYTPTMFGWLRRAAACASRRNRATKPASRSYGGSSTLIATVRSSAGS